LPIHLRVYAPTVKKLFGLPWFKANLKLYSFTRRGHCFVTERQKHPLQRTPTSTTTTNV